MLISATKKNKSYKYNVFIKQFLEEFANFYEDKKNRDKFFDNFFDYIKISFKETNIKLKDLNASVRNEILCEKKR